MTKWKVISENELKEIANKYRIDFKILDKLMNEWYYSIYMDENPEGFIDSDLYPEDLYQRQIDLAVISIFYHDNINMVKSNKMTIFNKVKFLSNREDKDIELKAYFANRILTSYLSNLKEWSIMHKEDALKVLRQKHKLGKRSEAGIVLRDYMIRGAANYLKSNNVRAYSPIIKELLYKMGIAIVQTGTIRRIVNR